MCLLKKLNEEGMTIIMVTHDEKVASYANRTIRMFDGKLLWKVIGLKEKLEIIQERVQVPLMKW